MKKKIGHLYFCIQAVLFNKFQFSLISNPIKVSGTTSKALKVAPKAMAFTGVPEKYKWCKVPKMPPAKKIVADATETLPAVLAEIIFI